MTRWLDEDEQRTWRSFLATSELLYAALDRQLQRDAGITHASYIVLAMLSEAPDRALRMSDLAVRANSSPSRLSHAAHPAAVREHLFDRLGPEQVRELGEICAAVLDGLSPNRVAPPC